jgi:NAD(P)-dependent dehydrogenase (short-subunit alcohol dehydrogenase family)
MATKKLAGQYAWVIGGAGCIGTGLCRGLLRAGATVVVSSRHLQRLMALREELGFPDRLHTLNGSMLAGASEETVEKAMELTGGQLDHVVAHSAVRWWTSPAESDETTSGALVAIPRGKLFDMSAEDFGDAAVQLPRLQFEAARLLLPRLTDARGDNQSTYTFVTGGSGEAGHPGVAQVNAQGVWGLAAAVRARIPSRALGAPPGAL